jgi:2-oxoglutarate ferredoxin oxidoreductase subunit alpha
MSETQLAIAITGAGGAGVISCGELLLKAWSRAGGYGLLRKAFGPQIRGGEAAALLKLTGGEVYTAASSYQVIVALDWVNFSRFEDEIGIADNTVILCASRDGMPEALHRLDCCTLPLAELAEAAHAEGRVNMVVAGILARALGLPAQWLVDLASARLAGKAEAYRESAAACIHAGYGQVFDLSHQLPARSAQGSWCLTGNQAAAYGALRAGVRFAAAYPITPASDALEWLADGLERVGGHLVQAEDELAAINMALGAAFGGVAAFTATSGPGLALMTESIGLAVASETAVTILNVMRGGPSTGIPTKSEQSDLNIALHGLHGDAPHLVLAPLDVADCAVTTGWAVQLAQRLQVPAIVLSDQFLGQSTAVVSPPRQAPGPALADGDERDAEYLRYRLTDSGVSTIAHPGDNGTRYTADGLEHNERGTPSARASDHRDQLAKRRRKLEQFDFGPDWAQCAGNGDIGLLCFGSASAAIDEAAGLLSKQGIPVRTVALRLLSPVCVDGLEAALAGCRRVIVVEQNHGAQLYRYLRGYCGRELESLAIPGPVPLAPRLIVEAVASREAA